MANSVSSISPPHDLQERFDAIYNAAKDLHANNALMRLNLVWDNSKTLSTETAYRWIDPAGLIVEVEEIQAHPAVRCRQWSNLVAILPIILSWFSLAYAMFSYQRFLLANPKAADQPFIELWQEGFGHRDPYSLSVTALVAASILIIYGVLLAIANALEARAHHRTEDFSSLLRSFLSELDRTNVRKPLVLPHDADLPQVTDAIQNSITKAIETSSQAITTAQEDLEALLHTFREHEEMLDARTTKVVTVFQDQMNTFRPAVISLTAQVDQVVPLFQKMTSAVVEMAKSFSEHAGRYELIGTGIDQKIPLWTETQQQLTSRLKETETHLTSINSAIQANTGVITNAQTGLQTVLKVHRADIEQLNEQAILLMSNVGHMLRKTVEHLETLTTTMDKLPDTSQDLAVIAQTLGKVVEHQEILTITGANLPDVSQDLAKVTHMLEKVVEHQETLTIAMGTVEQIPSMVRNITQEFISAPGIGSNTIQLDQIQKKRPSWRRQFLSRFQGKKPIVSVISSQEPSAQMQQEEPPVGQER